ncbi:MAG: MgtC/SapB family protein [Deltaproteobacteria bacterium]|nr:MgtC/SapB family protein [Deltaproteobacteria bacterium]
MNAELLFLRDFSVTWLVKIGVSVLCGALVGIERQLKRKAAGMRTNVMISLGATLYVLAAELIAQKVGMSAIDPTRVAGQVVVGMGFIGAGSIIQSRGRIHGLTTAATLWVVAAIGVLVGLGFPLLAIGVTLLVIFLLVGVGHFEHLMLGKCRLVSTRLSFHDTPEIWEQLQHLFTTYEHKLLAERVQRKTMPSGETICFMEMDYCHVHPDHAEFLLEVLKIPDVRQTQHRVD